MSASLDAFTSDADAREVAQLCARLPHQVGPLALRYLGLFRPRQRALAWSRARKLLTELVEFVEAGGVERHGRFWPAPPEVWASAMQQMLDNREKLRLPLSGHGYLAEIVTGSADKAEAKAEREEEAEVKAAGEKRRNRIRNARQEIAGARERAEKLRMAPPTTEDIAAIWRKYGLSPQED
ncbi:hypothetical protein [Algiphilus sp.]|uniref:hypothetical protein n=1 Tax=Algiphilus sp. TaxID=1872431 RepID=UPI0025BB37B5|nr:hypothetical protein [Algiphilus sp.]MCK5772021.1 hypothetical protein [Algiphilus sp.]